MAFDNFGPEDNKQLFNQDKANKWLRATVPLSGARSFEYASKEDGRYLTASFPSTHKVSGSAEGSAGPLAYGQLHVIMSKNDFHAVASSDSLLTASVDYQFFPANVPLHHIPRSGSTEYVSFINADGSNLEVWVSVVEF